MTNTVHIKAFTNDSQLVLEEYFDLGTYYDEDHPVIDDDEFRICQAITFVEGDWYDDAGNLFQSWRTYYDQTGVLKAAERWRRDEAELGWVTMNLDLPT